MFDTPLDIREIQFVILVRKKKKPTMSHHYAYNKMAKNKKMLAIPSAKRMHNL